MSVAENIAAVRERIRAAAECADRDPAGIRLVGVTKTVALDVIAAAIEAGLTDLGENFVQEAASHHRDVLRSGSEARWHFIGHLQSNKTKNALELFDIIHSVDSLRLAEQLSQRGSRRLPILLEVNVAGEASKHGFAATEVNIAVSKIAALPNLELQGLMTIAPAAGDSELVRPVFRQLRELAQANGLSELSMGMTDDFETAIEEGATIVRVGRAIFGERL